MWKKICLTPKYPVLILVKITRIDFTIWFKCKNGKLWKSLTKPHEWFNYSLNTNHYIREKWQIIWSKTINYSGIILYIIRYYIRWEKRILDQNQWCKNNNSKVYKKQKKKEEKCEMFKILQNEKSSQTMTSLNNTQQTSSPVHSHYYERVTQYV